MVASKSLLKGRFHYLKKYFSRSIERTIKILNILNESTNSLNLTEISRNSGLSKSTTFRILSDLQNELFVSKNDSTNKYSLGMGLLSFSRFIRENDEIRKLVFPYMEKLSRETEESIELCFIIDNCRISIEKIDSPLAIRHTIELGKKIPLYAGANGKVILAFLNKDKINEILYENKLIAFTTNTITDPVTLEKELEKIRKNKYALSNGEHFLNTASIAVPIFSFHNKVIGSLSINMPDFRFSKKVISRFVPIIKEIGMEISKQLT